MKHIKRYTTFKQRRIAIFEFYIKLRNVYLSIQFPYGSPAKFSANRVAARFADFVFTLKMRFVRYLSAFLFFHRTIILTCMVLRKKAERTVHCLSNSRLRRLKHMRIDIQSRSRITMSQRSRYSHNVKSCGN